jgi:hypothetical protein
MEEVEKEKKIATKREGVCYPASHPLEPLAQLHTFAVPFAVFHPTNVGEPPRLLQHALSHQQEARQRVVFAWGMGVCGACVYVKGATQFSAQHSQSARAHAHRGRLTPRCTQGQGTKPHKGTGIGRVSQNELADTQSQPTHTQTHTQGHAVSNDLAASTALTLPCICALSQSPL